MGDIRAELPTLFQPASWCNAAGRIDRSACVAVRCAAVRRAIEPWQWSAARTFSGRVATAVTLVLADRIEAALEAAAPRQINGDWRTSRAPAMRPLDWQPGLNRVTRVTGTIKLPRGRKGFSTRINHRRDLPEHDYGLDGNPNKGASRRKVLALPAHWTHRLRVEQWHSNLPGHFAYWLVCPGGGIDRGARGSEAQGWEAAGSEAREWESVCFGGRRVARLSTAKRGSKGGAPPQQCPQRVQCLFLVLATPGEYRDAQAAQRWIAGLSSTLRLRHGSALGQLLRRYGLLFHPRRLLCRRCLGLRYGNDPEKIRRTAQKRLDQRRSPRIEIHGPGR